MAITFVASALMSYVSSSAFSMAKPAGTVTDDVMVATVAFASGSSVVTVNAPAGWTKVGSQRVTNGSSSMDVWVYIKKVVASKPSTSAWSFSAALTDNLFYSVCATYRGASGVVLANAWAQSTTSSPLSSATVNNTQPLAWRITSGASVRAHESSGSGSSSNEVAPRTTFPVQYTNAGLTKLFTYGFWDSNGAVPTGNTSRTMSLVGTSAWQAAVLWIGILEEGSATPASGSVTCTMPSVTSAWAGSVHDDATVAGTLPSPLVVAIDGLGSPIPVDGVLETALPFPVVLSAGGTAAAGAIEVATMPSVSIVAETVPFGIRVIAVEVDNRTIRVESRGVAD